MNQGISPLITPYGGRLVDLLVAPDEAADLTARAPGLPSIRLSERQLCDLELLATGAFSPLDRFMGEEDHARVLSEMRLADGHLFPIPVTLSVDPEQAYRPGQEVALRDSKNCLLAVMMVEAAYRWEMSEVAQLALGTRDPSHPLVAEMHGWGRINLSGRLRVVSLPRRLDFRGLRLTPVQTRARLAALGRENIVAFQTRNPMHRAHEELTTRAALKLDGVLLLHPVAGMTKPGDVDHYTRVRTYEAVAANYDPSRILLSLLPLAMRMAGPREALWHALIRRNYGANHIIIGRDHASPGKDSSGHPFYGPDDARELVERFGEELGVGVVPFKELVYLPDEGRFDEVSNVPPGARTRTLSGSQVREEYLSQGRPLPDWYVRPEVGAILAAAYRPRHRQGFCIWLTGLSGAGKSTTAEALTISLLEKGRQITLLDGDVVRTHISSGLGFSKEDRDANVRRIGFVAAEIVRHGGACVCAAVSPYRAARADVRNMVGGENFIEVYVNAPLEVCEARDTKGLYAKARKGEISNFTGISDPYEPPRQPELVLDSVKSQPDENALLILAYLARRGFIDAP
jgi:sulfate adenylyltransferase